MSITFVMYNNHEQLSDLITTVLSTYQSVLTEMLL